MSMNPQLFVVSSFLRFKIMAKIKIIHIFIKNSKIRTSLKFKRNCFCQRFALTLACLKRLTWESGGSSDHSLFKCDQKFLFRLRTHDQSCKLSELSSLSKKMGQLSSLSSASKFCQLSSVFFSKFTTLPMTSLNLFSTSFTKLKLINFKKYLNKPLCSFFRIAMLRLFFPALFNFLKVFASPRSIFFSLFSPN